LKSYLEVSSAYFANPSSIHGLGVKAGTLLLKAREQILKLLKCHEHDLIFTSGATESNNLALKGYALKYLNRGKHIISTRIEHPSVLETLRQLENLFGFTVTYLPVDSKGVINIEDLKAAIRKDTILVSVMAVNNEVGSINPIHEISKVIRKYPKIALHVDCVQAIGKVDLIYDDIDLISFTGHKINSVKGVGALIIKKRISLIPVNCGGGQEDNLRSGTNDLAGAVALSKALRITKTKKIERREYIRNIALPLMNYLNENPDLYELNSDFEINPFIVNFSLKTKKASVVVEALSNEGIMVSSISACHSKGEKASYVVKEMGKDDNLAHNTIRISMSHTNTSEEVNILINKLDEIVRGIRG
jgi:cysteine desulfurase